MEQNNRKHIGTITLLMVVGSGTNNRKHIGTIT